MNLFAPPYKNLLKKAPPAFGRLMEELDPAMVDMLVSAGVPSVGLNASRNVLYGEALITYGRITGMVSPECLAFATSTGQNAVRMYPKHLMPIVQNAARMVNLTIEEQLSMMSSAAEAKRPC